MSIEDNKDELYYFEYKCPGCGVIAKVRLPLNNGVLDIGWSVKCEKCGNTSRPASYISNISKIYRSLDNKAKEQDRDHNTLLLVDAVSACAAIVINADKVVKPEEINAYRKFCSVYFLDYFEYAIERLDFYLANAPVIDKVIWKLRIARTELKELILELLCDIASCDGDFALCEQTAIDKLVSDLSIPASKWYNLKAKLACTGEEYKVLGIQPGATFEEIKQAYLSKCKEFHPDLYQSLPQSFKDFANQKFIEVQKAFEKLRQKYEN